MPFLTLSPKLHMPFPRQMAEISSFKQKQMYTASLFYKEIVYIVFHPSLSQII